VAIDANGHVFATGYVSAALLGQQHGGAKDVFLRKYDSTVQETWTVQFGGTGDDESLGIAVDGVGNIYIVGTVKTPLPDQIHSGNIDAFLRKYDASGNEAWTRQFGTFGNDEALGVTVDGIGNVYVVGTTEGALPDQTYEGYTDAFVRKYNASGDEVWTRQFGFTGIDGASAVSVDAAGNVYVAGKVEGALSGETYEGFIDAFVRKYDASGTELWTRHLASSARDGALAIATNTMGKVYVAGETEGSLRGQTHLGDTDIFLTQVAQ